MTTKPILVIRRRTPFVAETRLDFITLAEVTTSAKKLQPRGRNAKPYQVKQVRNVILKYRLGDASEE